MAAKYRAWIFTLNNPHNKGVGYIKDKSEGVGVTEDFYKSVECRYLIVGDEVGEAGTPHHQGYIYFKNPVRQRTVIKRLPAGVANVVPARGSPTENKSYCSKEKLLIEVGELPQKGKRTDLGDTRQAVLEGCTLREIMMTGNSYQSIRSAELLLTHLEKKRDWVPEVYWFWGPTGTGKTRTALEMAPDAWISGKDLKRWQGYDAHEDVIIDDFRENFCSFVELLRICDRYPYSVEYKGGSRQLLAKRIFITTPLPPEQTFNTNEDVKQLIRRIKEVRKFGTQDWNLGRGVIIDPLPHLDDDDIDAILQDVPPC